MDKDLLKIELLQQYLNKGKVIWTNHCLKRLNQRNILIPDVKFAIRSGEIIEYYYDDYPYQSCLVLGYSMTSKMLHIVCGMSEEIMYIITAYYPNSGKWEEDMKIRRKK